MFEIEVNLTKLRFCKITMVHHDFEKCSVGSREKHNREFVYHVDISLSFVYCAKASILIGQYFILNEFGTISFSLNNTSLPRNSCDFEHAPTGFYN